jgi:hypothetical protein
MACPLDSLRDRHNQANVLKILEFPVLLGAYISESKRLRILPTEILSQTFL